MQPSHDNPHLTPFQESILATLPEIGGVTETHVAVAVDPGRFSKFRAEALGSIAGALLRLKLFGLVDVLYGKPVRWVRTSAGTTALKNDRDGVKYPVKPKLTLVGGKPPADFPSRAAGLGSEIERKETGNGFDPRLVDFPLQVIVMISEYAKGSEKKLYYLRLKEGRQHVRMVDLDDAATPLGARKIAEAFGFGPTHWYDASDGILVRF